MRGDVTLNEIILVCAQFLLKVVHGHINLVIFQHRKNFEPTLNETEHEKRIQCV